MTSFFQQLNRYYKSRQSSKVQNNIKFYQMFHGTQMSSKLLLLLLLFFF